MRRITAFGDGTNYLGSNCLFDGNTQTVLIAMNKTHTLYYHIYVSTLCFECVNGSWLNINSACRCCCCCVYCRRVSGSYQIAHTSPYIYIRAHRCNNHKLIIKRYIYIYVICMYVCICMMISDACSYDVAGNAFVNCAFCVSTAQHLLPTTPHRPPPLPRRSYQIPHSQPARRPCIYILGRLWAITHIRCERHSKRDKLKAHSNTRR